MTEPGTVGVGADGRQAYSSAEVSKNSRGYSWSVKVYVPIGEEDALIGKVANLERLLSETFGGAEDDE